MVVTPRHPIAIAAAQVRSALVWADVRIVCLVFLAAQMLDGVTTYMAVSTDRFQEANPIFADIVGRQPIAAFTVKFALAGAALLAVLGLRLRWRLRRAVLVSFAVVALTAPLANGLRVMGAL